MNEARFTGTDRYVATPDLMIAVNAAVTLGRPLLIKGEPGTGKTQLAEEIARRAAPAAVRVAHQVHEQGAAGPVRIRRRLAPARFAARRREGARHPQLHREGQFVGGVRIGDVQPVLLIDEIDKADIEFPNDLLRELDRMEFYVHETRELVKARHRPDHPHHQQQRERAAGRVPAPLLLPLHPFSRRGRRWRRSSACTYPTLKSELLREALTTFFDVRETPGLRKKPSTSELLDWIKLLARRRHPARGAARRRSEENDPDPARRAAQERAGRAPVRTAGVPEPPRRPLMPAQVRRMLDPLLHRSARRRRPGRRCRSSSRCSRRSKRGSRRISPKEFYYLARMALVKDERHFDRFDRVFAEHFEGAQKLFEKLAAELPPEWLKQLTERLLTEEEKRARRGARRLGQAARDAARNASRAEGAARRRQQVDRHGRHLAVRSPRLQPRRRAHRAGRLGHRRAVKVWDARDYRNLDDGVELGTRNLKMALRRLRRFAREGARRRARSRRHHRRDRAQRRPARPQARARAAQRREAAVAARRRRVDGSARQGLRGAVLRRACRVQAPRIFLLPQLPVRAVLEGQPPAIQRGHRAR